MELQGFLFCITLYCRSPHHPKSFIPIILEGNNHICHSSYDKYDLAHPTSASFQQYLH